MKISLDNLDKIMDLCTKKEIDFIIYIGQFQDDYGYIKGINYKDVIKNIGIAKSTFYKLLYSLEVKEILEINYINEYNYWEVTILDNIFASKEDYTKGYIKLNYQILHSCFFKELTKAEKVIIFNLIKIKDFTPNKIKLTINRLKTWTGKSRRSVLNFIETLSQYFNISRIDNLVLIDTYFPLREQNESDTRNIHLIHYRLSKLKGEAFREDIQDTNTVFKQYKIKTTETIINILDTVIQSMGWLFPQMINKVTQQYI